jgi:hypothetical protein
MYNPTNPGYSTQNQTRVTPNYEPTVSDNPYASSPYDLQNVPTPPKPPHAYNRLVLSLVMVIVALVIVFAGSVIWLQYANKTTSVSSSSTPTPVTAKSIVQDFIKHNLPIDQITYGAKFGYTGVITEQSSASFVDPSFCGGHACGVGFVWLGVYLTSSDTQIVYTNFERLESTPLPVETSALPSTTILINRCLLIGEPSTSQFVQIVKNDCV